MHFNHRMKRYSGDICIVPREQLRKEEELIAQGKLLHFGCPSPEELKVIHQVLAEGGMAAEMARVEEELRREKQDAGVE